MSTLLCINTSNLNLSLHGLINTYSVVPKCLIHLVACQKKCIFAFCDFKLRCLGFFFLDRSVPENVSFGDKATNIILLLSFLCESQFKSFAKFSGLYKGRPL